MRQRREAQAREEDGGATVRVPGVTFLGLFEPSAVRLQERGVVRGALRGAGELPGEPVELRQVRPGLAEGVVEYVGDRRAGVELHLLAQEAHIGGPGDTAGVRLVRSGEEPQQGRLAHPVLPDQADAVAGGRGE